MRRNNSHKSLKDKTVSNQIVRRAIVTLAAFVITYVIVWFILIYQFFYPNPQSIISQLSAFSKKHHSQIEESIFNTAFNASLRCRSVNTEQQAECYKKVGIYMAHSINEEELVDVSKPNANELFFVKIKENMIYSLGWSGKIKEVELKGNEIIFNNSLFFLRLLTGNCGRLLNLQEESMKLCEVTVPVKSYVSNEQHFIAWKVNGQEEYSIWQDILIFPPLIALTVLGDPMALVTFVVTQSPVLVAAVVVAYVLPFIAAYFVWWLYDKIRQNNHRAIKS